MSIEIPSRHPARCPLQLESVVWFQTARVVSLEIPIETTLVPATVLEYLPTHRPDDLIINPIVT